MALRLLKYRQRKPFCAKQELCSKSLTKELNTDDYKLYCGVEWESLNYCQMALWHSCRSSLTITSVILSKSTCIASLYFPIICVMRKFNLHTLVIHIRTTSKLVLNGVETLISH